MRALFVFHYFSHCDKDGVLAPDFGLIIDLRLVVNYSEFCLILQEDLKLAFLEFPNCLCVHIQLFVRVNLQCKFRYRFSSEINQAKKWFLLRIGEK
mgnify:CR=1